MVSLKSGSALKKNPSPRRQSQNTEFKWPKEGLYRIPDWIYTSQEIYEREIERIFRGPTWSFVGLEIEIPNPGDFRRAYIGNAPVLTVRGKDGKIHVVENRCAHRGTEFCRTRAGHAESFVCPYHQWQYDLEGNLLSVPFRRGINKKGGMPSDFNLAEHGLRKLRIETVNGLIFATFSDEVEPLREYLGREILEEIEVMFKDRSVRILGYFRQRWPTNWKLYHENLRDPNHGSLLHVFLSTFGLFRPDTVSMQVVSQCGRHSIGLSRRGDQELNETTRQMSAFKADLRLKDDRLLNYVKEDQGPWSAAIQSVWPNFAVQRQLNALAVREIIPQGPDAFYLYWTILGYADDDATTIQHRLRQANLIGPAGLIGVDDSEVLEFVQDGLEKSIPSAAVVRLGKEETGTADTFISESAIRSLYSYYRNAMGL